MSLYSMTELLSYSTCLTVSLSPPGNACGLSDSMDFAEVRATSSLIGSFGLRW
jgi:hypothetical protein